MSRRVESGKIALKHLLIVYLSVSRPDNEERQRHSRTWDLFLGAPSPLSTMMPHAIYTPGVQTCSKGPWWFW